jgi:twitching motility protein PilI
MSAEAAPFAILTDIARRSRSLSKGLPAQEEAVELWNGIGFVLNGQRYVAPMGEVVEILHIPRYTQIPGVKTFMLGAANVRGRLLPLIDLAAFVGLPRASRSHRERRALVVEQDDIFCGLIVDSVLGMQYFDVDSFFDDPKEENEALSTFLHGGYLRNEELWKVFSMIELVEDERFLDVAQW